MRRAVLLRAIALTTATIGLLLGVFLGLNRLWPSPWSVAQESQLRELWIGSLGPLPADPTNRVANDPRAAELGARLFHDRRLGRDGKLSCASCHRPELAFSDGRVVARGLGDGTRNTPSIVAAARSPSYFWDGRRDSQWSQALGPLESAHEMGTTRGAVVSLVARHYRKDYEAIFGALPKMDVGHLAQAGSPLGSPEAREAFRSLGEPERDAINGAFANVGKAIAAYERSLSFAPSRFDRYVSHVLRGNHLLARATLTLEERAGLELFIGRANCTLCHRGPLLTGHDFFSLGLPFGASGPDPGRGGAFELLRSDPFNCQGRYSDAKPEACDELRFLADDKLGFLANFKTPSLRNVARTAPYMHAGQFTTLREVVEHYNRAPSVPFPEHTDILPLDLSAAQKAELVAFLGTLTSDVLDPYADARFLE
jgi:cytochrome c peroxidase